MTEHLEFSLQGAVPSSVLEPLMQRLDCICTGGSKTYNVHLVHGVTIKEIKPESRVRIIKDLDVEEKPKENKWLMEYVGDSIITQSGLPSSPPLIKNVMIRTILPSVVSPCPFPILPLLGLRIQSSFVRKGYVYAEGGVTCFITQIYGCTENNDPSSSILIDDSIWHVELVVISEKGSEIQYSASELVKIGTHIEEWVTFAEMRMLKMEFAKANRE